MNDCFDSVFHRIAALLLFAAAIGALALWLKQPLAENLIAQTCIEESCRNNRGAESPAGGNDPNSGSSGFHTSFLSFL
jgi:hypothetical protein